MNINATLFVQMINFYIFYLIMRKWLFKPVIAIIDVDNTKKSHLMHTIEDQRITIENKEKERQEQRHSNRAYFQKHWPFNTETVHTSVPLYGETNSTADMHKEMYGIDDMVQEIKKKLEEKIKHVH